MELNTELQIHFPIEARAMLPLRPLKLHVHGATKFRENMLGQSSESFGWGLITSAAADSPFYSARGMQALHTRNYFQLQLLGIHNKCLRAKTVHCGQCRLSCHIGTTMYSPLLLGYWAVTLTSSGAVVLDQKLLLLSTKFCPVLMPSLYRYHSLLLYARTRQLTLFLTAREEI